MKRTSWSRSYTWRSLDPIARREADNLDWCDHEGRLVQSGPWQCLTQHLLRPQHPSDGVKVWEEYGWPETCGYDDIADLMKKLKVG
jgi:hypothetical protein